MRRDSTSQLRRVWTGIKCSHPAKMHEKYPSVAVLTIGHIYSPDRALDTCRYTVAVLKDAARCSPSIYRYYVDPRVLILEFGAVYALVTNFKSHHSSIELILSNLQIKSILIQPHGRIGLDEVEINLVTQKLSDIAHAVPVPCQQICDVILRSGSYLIIVGRSRLNPHP